METEKKSEKEEEKTETTKGKYIVRSKDYGGSYYDGNAGYHSDFLKAKIYNDGEVPDYIKNNPREEVIALDSVEGLAILVEEFKRNQDYADIYGARVEDAKETMRKLYKFGQVQKYIELHNKWNHPIIGISHDTENRILEEIVEGKE
jgi:hypothetical protein